MITLAQIKEKVKIIGINEKQITITNGKRNYIYTKEVLNNYIGNNLKDGNYEYELHELVFEEYIESCNDFGDFEYTNTEIYPYLKLMVITNSIVKYSIGIKPFTNPN